MTLAFAALNFFGRHNMTAPLAMGKRMVDFLMANWQWLAGISAVGYALLSAFFGGKEPVASDVAKKTIDDETILKAYLVVLAQARLIADDERRKVLVEALVRMLVDRTAPVDRPTPLVPPTPTPETKSDVARLLEQLLGGKA